MTAEQALVLEEVAVMEQVVLKGATVVLPTTTVCTSQLLGHLYSDVDKEMALKAWGSTWKP